MPFTLMKSAATAAHAMAQGAEEFEDQDGDSQMGTGADKPLRTDDAEKGVRNHPDSGRFMATGETAHGAHPGPITAALAQHQGPAPLASLQTVPSVVLGSSIAPGEVRVQSLDYRGSTAPVAASQNPIRPDVHQAPNGVRQ